MLTDIRVFALIGIATTREALNPAPPTDSVIDGIASPELDGLLLFVGEAEPVVRQAFDLYCVSDACYTFSR